MQKVISININTSYVNSEGYQVMKFPELEKHLKDGYKIIEKIPMIPTSNNYVNITFIIQK